MSLQSVTEVSQKDLIVDKVMPEYNMEAIERAIILTVAYADVFDFPLTVNEIHNYLIGTQAPLEMVSQALRDGRLTTRFLTYEQGYFALHGRESIVDMRRRRATIAAKLWPKAQSYGKLIALLPFTRMVAVTGALAMDNTDRNADIDFMIVTEPGRLWLCRAMVILLVRWAALHSDTICPNLFVSEKALVYHKRDLYTAHEMVQMIPIAGHNIYHNMMALNAWTLDFLPNSRSDDLAQTQNPNQSWMRLMGMSAEKFLRIPLLDRLEQWEMKRKIRKFNRQNVSSNEANFSADWCRGYFNSHEQRTLSAFAERVSTIEAAGRLEQYQ